MTLLVSVLTPLSALLVGWLVFSVPPPSVLAAARKQVTVLVASDGKTEVGRYVPEEGNRIDVNLAQVPMQVQNAVLAAEDRSFRSNPGFDMGAIARAIGEQLTGGSGGGSTITQQYIKVVTGHDEYSLLRKFREVIIAAKLTKRESKDQILQDYLNTIYFGRDAYGIQAASQAYFGKNVQNLTVSEAALLAGLIRSPSRLDPAIDLAAAQVRWNAVLDGMVEQGWLSPADRAVQRFPTTLPLSQARQILGAPTDDRAHIVDRVLKELEKQGITRAQLAVGGGRILTTIDPRAQQMARDAVRIELRGQPSNLHSSLVAIDPRSGAVLAYYGGSDGNGFDLAGGLAWSPGSAFKPFTMVAALERGIGMYSVYDGKSPVVIDGRSYSNSESLNYPRLTLKQAMTLSVNTAFVRLAQDVGAQAIRDAAIQAGIPEEINGKPAMAEPDSGVPGIGITLGQYPVHTIDMASAYATFAADGMRREPFFVREYDNSHGGVEYQHADKPQLAFDPADPAHNAQLARNVTATLTDVARSSQIPLVGGRQVAAKTGTHQLGDTGHNAAAWTIGYTPSISTAVWVGDPANSAIRNANGADVFGRGLPGAIWQHFMNSYVQGTPRQAFPPFELIGPPPTTTRSPAWRTDERRNTDPFAPQRPGFQDTDPFAPQRGFQDTDPFASPQPDFQDTEPPPLKPSKRPATRQRSDCYPFCQDAPARR
ncbi:MAG TPA: transglycosylase domain-containing protein [Pseudonocardiaceae bacterium]|nr:transglycosylase domain-containing protein [Pseudonocardiaceae bacterium]